MLGLAFVLALASPPKANAGVVMEWASARSSSRAAYGIRSGTSAVLRCMPMAYAPVYARSYYVHRPYGDYGHAHPSRYWAHRDWRAIGETVARDYRRETMQLRD